MSDSSIILKALTGSATPGQYPDTLHDRLDAALAEAWTESTGLNIQNLPSSGADPGPFRSNGADAWSDLMDQATARYGAAPKARTLTEKAALLEALLRGIDASKNKSTSTTPTTTPSTNGGNTLPTGTSQGVAQWKADLSKNDVISAGFKSTSWNTEHGPSWPPPIVNQAGKRCIKFQLGSGGKRIEVEPNHRTFPKGDDAWFGFSFYLDNDFPLSASSWQVIWQLHGNDTVSPQQAIQCHKGGLTIADNKSFATVSKNQWYKIVVHANFGSGGAMSVWLNDQNVLSNYSAGLNNPPMYLKCGLYHDTAIAGGTIYEADHALGTGYGAVRPAG